MIFESTVQLYDVELFTVDERQFLKLTVGFHPQITRWFEKGKIKKTIKNRFSLYLYTDVEKAYNSLRAAIGTKVYVKGFEASVGTITHKYLTEFRFVSLMLGT